MSASPGPIAAVLDITEHKSDAVVSVGLPKGSPCSAVPARAAVSSSAAVGLCLLSGRHTQAALPCAWGGVVGTAPRWVAVTCCPLSPVPQRAIRVRSHSMETMVGSQKKHHGGGIPGSLSGGIAHNSGEVTKTTFSVSVSSRPSVPLSLCSSSAHPCTARQGTAFH